MRERTDEQPTTPHDPPEPEIHQATRRRVGPATSHGWGQLRVPRPHHVQPQVGPEQRRTVGPVQSATANVAVIALWLGHADIRSTDAYIHADLTIKENALARTT